MDTNDSNNKPITTEAFEAEKKAREQAELLLQQTIQELSDVKAKLAELSNFDPLTHLPNLQQFNEDLKRELARAKRYNRKIALLHLDLDYFKKINDTHGRDVGDLVLKEAADRLKKLLRTEDCAGRIGDDEFCAALTEIGSAHDAGLVAHRIVERMSEPYHVADSTVLTSVSIGIACFPDAGESTDELQRNAGIALQSAKGSGKKNYQFFTLGMQASHAHRLEIESELHFALERKELFLVYQPSYDLQTEDMVGMEVLLRWRHPLRGIVSPADFIPIAEETGLIIPIGEWVLKTSCEQYKIWREKNPSLHFKLSVNVSPRQFQNKSFIDVVMKTLEETAIPPHLLELEITESAVMNYLGKIEDSLFELRHAGVQFSIDDFGTGYSSLARLKELPIQSIKIDRSFVTDIDVKINDNLIVRSTIDLAKDMGLNIIAEGVETESQQRFLIQSRCPQAQGYYYSHPLTVDEMSHFIESIIKDRSTS